MKIKKHTPKWESMLGACINYGSQPEDYKLSQSDTAILNNMIAEYLRAMEPYYQQERLRETAGEEYRGAYDAARVEREVIDEEGVTIKVMRPPVGWMLEGCLNELQFVNLKCGNRVLTASSAQKAAMSAALALTKG